MNTPQEPANECEPVPVSLFTLGKKQQRFYAMIVALLGGILLTQLLILARMPQPTRTYSDYLKTKGRHDFLNHLPLVRVQGSVEVDQPLDVEVQNLTAVPVHIENEPLTVQIDHEPLDVRPVR